ncbi:MAG: carbamoyl-phosphate synthase large subunit [Deltaproteobacteria bacterium]|nr:carbamoyl-phosphate synthase large subunit [Deltaproteobacteria bacterium]
MPRRTDLKKIMLIGSGPIVIGQACEFDYSGTQGCKALKEEGYRVILVNSNPATIMTDPDFADKTYIEPVVPEIVAKIIAKERPNALLPTLGGQTALNVAVSLAEGGVLEKYHVELIGAKLPSIKKAEDRALFKQAMQKIGLEVPQSDTVTGLETGRALLKKLGLPIIIRPSFTLGGTGGNIATTEKEFEEQLHWALSTSPIHQVLLEESVLGWKEFELEVMRDLKDNVVIVCSIENFDPMGIHTGDSITVAPAQTLTDKEYQIMRNAAIAIIREIGVDTGGSNIQFAIQPKTGRMVVVEMNPRVSRSSALASKATGFPIAKIATKLAVGYTLDEIRNDITQYTPASFEPTIDYVVTKIPRFTFEKFPEADDTLTTQMKAVGEVMAIGRTFKESLQKAIRSLETDRYGFESLSPSPQPSPTRGEGVKNLVPPPLMGGDKGEGEIKTLLMEKLRKPTADRLWLIGDAFRQRFSVEQIHEITKIDPWFLYQIREIIQEETRLKTGSFLKDRLVMRRAKEIGFSDRRLSNLTNLPEQKIRQIRKKMKIEPVYKTVDTCAAEFKAYTPYLYSTYDAEDESNVTKKKKIVILGGGPNRIGQGIEFDYCCVHASFALKEEGLETIMVNCNPETVSTDYDTSDRLYFEPLTYEDVLNIIEKEKPKGVIVQFGGQTPLKLALSLAKAGVPIIGTSPENIDRAEDRGLFSQMLRKLKLRQPENGTAHSSEAAEVIANRIGYPVVVRPSYVLGGRAMRIVYDAETLRHYMKSAVTASSERPILIDKFLEAAIEVDVDCIADGRQVIIAGIMEHIEEAGIHSGDSAACLPPYSLKPELVEEIRRQTGLMAKELSVVGLMNVQFAVQGEMIYVLEVNPRASRTIPFVSKATGIPFAKLAAKVMAGKGNLKQLGFIKEVIPAHLSIKESVFPFNKFPGVDTLLGPEMKSTGEVMGINHSFGAAFAKSQLAAFNALPAKGKVFLSIRNSDKGESILQTARTFHKLNFAITATRGTAKFLKTNGIPSATMNKVKEGSPHIVDALKGGEIAMVINTVEGRESAEDSYSIRRTTLLCNIPYFTTTSAAHAASEAIRELKKTGLDVRSLQEYHLKKKLNSKEIHS